MSLDKLNIVILGSTGSIGVQALEIVEQHPERFNVVALSCNSSWEVLAEQVRTFNPEYALVCDEDTFDSFREAVGETGSELMSGADSLADLATLDQADVILNSLVGYAGFEPTMASLQAGKKVALANKESLVVGGALIKKKFDDRRDLLVPVDSEHSAIFQCLTGESEKDISKLVITASGGPFREWSPEQMENITVADALNHPNWSMGSKITIDSATMMNKGLEIIEAHWLFDLPLSKIEAVVHPQSIVHSIVEFVDGSSKAQLGPPTMKVPILYALTYPERIPLEVETLNWAEAFDLNFEPVDYKKFPCLRLAMDAIETGGFAPAVLNAANEIAVQRFLNEEIPYIGIPRIIERCLNRLELQSDITLEALKDIDRQTRELALTL